MTGSDRDAVRQDAEESAVSSSHHRRRRSGRTRDGRIIWLQASYNPVLNSQGKPEKIVKLATDITAIKNQDAAHASMVDAIQRSMAVAEFSPEAMLLEANDIFLKLMGYERGEVIGKPHRIFVDKEDAASPEYKKFWASLARGESQRGRFRRLSKTGETVWLEACYNPILDANGRLTRVVKFA